MRTDTPAPADSGAPPPPGPDRHAADAPRPRRSAATIAVRSVLLVVVLLIVAMWVYAFGFAEKQGLYVVDDEAWTQRAQGICEVYEQRRLELTDMDEGYIANPTNEQMLQRADIVDQATDLLQAELDEVFAVMPASVRDQELALEYRRWFEVLISDRRAYTERLRNFELGPYLETKIDGGPVTNLLVDFTTANRMKRCAPPGELGGDR